MAHPPLASRITSMAFRRRLHRLYAGYTVCFLVFLASMAVAERYGLPKNWIGFVFLAAPVVVYAVIGIVCRTTEAPEYYVAGRRVPAMPRKEAALIQSAPVAMPLYIAGTRRPAT